MDDAKPARAPGLGPCLLIASPQMHDPHFERAVVLVWHHDADGAIGVIINRMTEHTFPDVVSVDVDVHAYEDTLVGWGGPVETGSGTVVTVGRVDEDDGWNLADGLAVTRSQETLTALIVAHAPLLLVLGYAGWSAGQLDKEISEGGWLWTDLSKHIVFDVPPEDRYDLALAKLGVRSQDVWMRPISE
jgi:putative transcriptional regulator